MKILNINAWGSEQFVHQNKYKTNEAKGEFSDVSLLHFRAHNFVQGSIRNLFVPENYNLFYSK